MNEDKARLGCRPRQWIRPPSPVAAPAASSRLGYSPGPAASVQAKGATQAHPEGGSHPGLPDYARTSIEVTARGLVGKCGLTKNDLDDLISELKVDLLQHLSRHDATRAGLNTYTQVVVGGKAKRILRDRCRHKSSIMWTAESLDAPVGEDEGSDRLPLGERVGDDEIDSRLGRSVPSHHENAMLRIEVSAVIGRLPAQQQICCEVLMADGSISDAARLAGVPRKTYYDRVVVPIRRAFRDAGLNSYL